MLLIGGAKTLGDNALATARIFNSRRITVAVVAVSTPPFDAWSYYRTLARNTGHYSVNMYIQFCFSILLGGQYMLLANAKSVLSIVISSAINGENTLRQAFGQIRIPALLAGNHINETNEQNEIADNIDDLAFNHGLDN